MSRRRFTTPTEPPYRSEKYRKDSEPVRAAYHAAPRIETIDTLRGLDMFFLTGGMALLVAWIALFNGGQAPAWLSFHSTHVAWEGFAAWDLVMPLFIFIVGAAMPFSLEARKQTLGRRATVWRMLRRVAILFVLGMMAQGNLLSFKSDAIHLYSNTLQAIASGYLITGLCLLFLSRRGQIIAIPALLVSYWLMLKFIPFGNSPAGTLEPLNNLSLSLDHAVFGSLQDKTNNAWILPQLSFGALTLIGAMCGAVLKKFTSHFQRIGYLGIIGVGCLAIAYFGQLDMPIIKRIWTPTMTLWAAGWSTLLLALLYVICDVARMSWFSFPFRIIGTNALLAYMWVMLCPPTSNISHALFTGFSELFGSAGHAVFLTCSYCLFWGILYYLFKKKTFLRV